MIETAVRESFSRSDIRTVIKFFTLLHKSPTAIHQILQEALLNHCPSITTVRTWCDAVKAGRMDMEDESRSGRPSTSTGEEQVQAAERLVLADKRITCEHLANELQVSVSTAFKILTEKLGRRKICAKWIPHNLSEEQTASRMSLSSLHLRRYRREGDSFLQRIVAGDETWVHSWEPELKRQSAEWLTKEEPRPKKVAGSQFGMKVMHVIFFNYAGILLDWPVPHGMTVNGAYYKMILQEKLRPAIRKKQPDLLKSEVILLHDNARVHTQKDVVALLDQWDWEVLAHPPYSPDLSPCDFFLNPRMKEPLRGRHFPDETAINMAVKSSLKDLAAAGVRHGIYGLPERWQKCKDAEGQYFE
jgi:histone-lysine N-methyltransferase SETMAR